MLKAVVCDIGHVIARGSILNVVLAEIGRHDCAKKLYDAQRFYTCSTAEFDSWVREVIEEKIAALQGLSFRELKPLLSHVSMTPCFDDFIRRTGQLGLPVLLVGAVPAMIARLLLQLWNIEHPHVSVMGTELIIDNERIAGVRSVCTPTKKLEAVERWLELNGIESEDAIYIGDSVGDLIVMSSFPKRNRIAINASIQWVRAFCNYCVEDSFSEIAAVVEALTLGENRAS
ncbi:hypothetical protein sS8_0259 [Methylocaldum marinum]|uniref:Phosphoserine phosphatase n=1 Tax=Methylocaldum marinum TaxID=1432792 RepID=A0A286P3K5_9GAMM|nr:haloacid dehalogenase-like hydrolase [Methylocaldum marinum]BBA32227.1 hypothetical protein sS8_0259 [Methylocaldum marinum]